MSVQHDYRRWAMAIMVPLIIVALSGSCRQHHEAPPEAASASAPSFILHEQVLTVSTDRYEADFLAGAMIRLENRLTGETYTTAAADLPARLRRMPHGLATLAGADGATRKQVEQVHQWQGGYDAKQAWSWLHHPSEGATVTLEQLTPNRAIITWHGLQADHPDRQLADGKYTLDLAVLPGSGDLEIRPVADSGGQGGVFGCGFLMANFSRQLRFIVPVFQGFAFRPADEAPFSFVAHWPFPWAASVVVGEGETGSFGMWQADPEMRDRFLHLHNYEDGFDVLLQGVNHAPFDEQVAAAGRPIRINVYQGNWTQPAGAFRDWWATTFNVKPLAERHPELVRDLRWISSWGQLPPPDMSSHTVHFCPQIWKVGPPDGQGDGGLFPYDMEKGPELRGLANLLPTLRERQVEPYVYVNISHMCKAHPWAKRYWEYRTTPTFHDPAIAQDPRFGATGSYVVHCAARPWQDLMVDWVSQINRRFGIVGFYLDCAAGKANDARGLVAGKNDCQGQIELMTRIREAVPDAFLGAEYLSEVTAQQVDLAGIGYDGWFGGSRGFCRGREWREEHVHPILGFLYNRYVHLFFFGGQIPTFEETMGRIPLAGFRAPDAGDVSDYSLTESWIQMWARLRHRTGIRPFYPDPWATDVRAYYRDPQDVEYRVMRGDTPADTRMVRIGQDGSEELIYWRIRNRTDAALNPGTGIEGWIAYDGATAIGLHPQREYLYFGNDRAHDWEVTALPPGTFIDRCRPFRDGLLALELNSLDGESRTGMVELLTTHPLTGAITNQGESKLEFLGERDGRKHYRVAATVPGIVAFTAFPPRELPVADGVVMDFCAAPLGHVSCLGGAGVRVAMQKRHYRGPDARGQQFFLWPNWGGDSRTDYLLKLPTVPDGRCLKLNFQSWITHHRNNHYTLRIVVNGRDMILIKRQGGTDPETHAVDLTEFAGQAVLFTFAMDQTSLFEWAKLLAPEIVIE